MANSAVHDTKYVLETVPGTTPDTPAWTALRNTQVNLEPIKGLLRSEEASSVRQTMNVRHGVLETGGDINGELWYGDHDPFIEAVMGGTWAVDTPIAGTDQLKVGSTVRSFSILSNQTDIQSADKPIHTYKGVQMSTWNLAINAENIVTSTFGTMGMSMAVDTDEPAGSTTTPATNIEPMNSLVGTINIAGVPSSLVTELTMTIETGKQTLKNCMVSSVRKIEDGVLTVSGQFTLHFENSAQFEAFLNETEIDADVTITDPLGNSIKIILPAFKYTGSSAPRSGSDTIIVTAPFEAYYDETAQSTIVIERTPA